MTAALPALDQTQNLTDDDLMTLINGGDVRDVEFSLAELRSRYGERIFGLVHGIVRDSHLAEDISQEVFAKVFFKSHLYRPGSNFQAWLFEVARNQALSALRTRRHTPTPIGSLQMNHDDGGGDSSLERLHGAYDDRKLEEREFMSHFKQAVTELPDQYRRVFELCVQQGMQYKDAAHILGIPTGTVAIRIMRARKRLFQSLCCHMDRLRRPPACLQ